MAPRTTTRRRPPVQLIPLAQGCDRLDISTKTGRRWIADGKLCGYMVGGYLKVDAAEIERMIENARIGGGRR